MAAPAPRDLPVPTDHSRPSVTDPADLRADPPYDLGSSRPAPLPTYVFRRTVMHFVIAEQMARAQIHERHLEAAQRNRAARVRNARRLEKRAADAARRARAARSAVR